MVLGPLGLTNTTEPGQPGHRRGPSSTPGFPSSAPSTASRRACPFYVDSTYWDTSWSLAQGAIETTNIYDMDKKTAIAIGNGKLLSLESFKTMTNTKMRDQGGPVPGNAPSVIAGTTRTPTAWAWLSRTASFSKTRWSNGYSALEAYLPSQRIAISAGGHIR